MISIIAFITLLIISYFLGCFSTAKFITKSYKSMNIYKVGTGHPDTQNIFRNINKSLGIFVGIVDFGKMFFYLVLLDFLLNYSPVVKAIGEIGTVNHLLILGFAAVIGHCLPLTHRFKGGRGLFTYIGFVTFFMLWPMIIIVTLSLIIVIFFKQIRFAQYMIVLLPPFINFFFERDPVFLGKMFIVAILMGIINFFVSKKLREI
ncbi:MAG: glycerol-3-phosphate acyltransferase [Candidatus Cloacimonetes bacterium]|nr:glycerol-3-phosphate acyltransferase [Candidatus Cloacimonadota bacterium]MBL7148467.1 glycerol-3-phosphate acyltransferase [Candidatus Cloacimonadota bacterium]